MASIGGWSQAINSVTKDTSLGKFFFGGIRDAVTYATDKTIKDKNFKELANAAFNGQKGDLGYFEAGGMGWNGVKIAGGLGGIGIGYRFASGGGAYRDKNGNTDIAGIPFI